MKYLGLLFLFVSISYVFSADCSGSSLVEVDPAFTQTLPQQDLWDLRQKACNGGCNGTTCLLWGSERRSNGVLYKAKLVASGSSGYCWNATENVITQCYRSEARLGGQWTFGGQSYSLAFVQTGTYVTGALTDCQQEIIFRVTSVFETGSQNLRFDFCDYENDGQGYDAGFMSATSRSGTMLGIVKLFCKTKPNNSLCSMISPLQKAVGSNTKNGLSNLCGLWKSAAADKAFHDAQWQYTVDNFFSPATKHAQSIGLTNPLAIGQLYDTNIQLGDGNGQNSLGGIINTVNGKVGNPSKAGQTKWLTTFLDERTKAENRLGGAYPATVYRINSYRHVVQVGQSAMNGKTVEFLNNSGGKMPVTCTGGLH